MRARTAIPTDSTLSAEEGRSSSTSPGQQDVRAAHDRVGNQALLASLGEDSKDPQEVAWQEQVDEFQKQYQAMVDVARILGFDVAADNLEHFLAGTGGVRELPVEWLRSFDEVLEAERTNQERFEASLAEAAKSMVDGESRTITDHWDRVLIAGKTTELYYASGTRTLTSTGTFTLQKAEGRVEVTGEVTHSWKDPYDWHPGATAFVPGFGVVNDKDARSLVFERGAKEFDMAAGWGQCLTASVVVVEWWPDSEDYRWSAP